MARRQLERGYWLALLRNRLRRLRGRPLAQLRAVGLTLIRNNGESCDRCGRAYGCVWWAPNDDWPRVYERAVGRRCTSTPGRDWTCHSGTLCPRCYTRAARALGLLVTWHPIPTHARSTPADRQ